MKLADLERHLRGHKCFLLREGGSHTLWKNPANGKSTAVPRHREIKDNTARALCKQLGIPRPE